MSSMYVEQVNADAAGICFGSGFKVSSMLRKGAVVYCEADRSSVNLEKVLVEFESEEVAERFEKDVGDGIARIIIEEDERKKFWDDLKDEPVMREKFLEAERSGDKKRIGAVLDELWNEYEIIGYDDPAPETSGIVRIAIMHSHGVNAFGFKGRKKELKRWMARNQFDPKDLHHCRLEMFD